jgi:hypothetical protein
MYVGYTATFIGATEIGGYAIAGAGTAVDWQGGTISGTIDVQGGSLLVEGTVAGTGTIDSDGGAVTVGGTTSSLTGVWMLGPVGMAGPLALSGTNAGNYDTTITSGTISSDNGWVIRPTHTTVIAPGARLVVDGSR